MRAWRCAVGDTHIKIWHMHFFLCFENISCSKKKKMWKQRHNGEWASVMAGKKEPVEFSEWTKIDLWFLWLFHLSGMHKRERERKMQAATTHFCGFLSIPPSWLFMNIYSVCRYVAVELAKQFRETKITIHHENEIAKMYFRKLFIASKVESIFVLPSFGNFS